jgi:MoaA/NifB/PqqE/SkfB family radical SAM enzyme
MCNIVESSKDLTPFDHDKITKIADNLVKIWAGVVLLTWGEPFMRPDIDDIVKIFKNKWLDVRMQTAWLLVKKDKIAECVENGARDINVSIDSLDEELSDYINWVKWSRKLAMKTISFISKTFPKKDSICALWCVLSNYNLDEIESVLEFATKIWRRLSLVPAHISTIDKIRNFRWIDEYFKIPPERFDELKKLIERLKKKKRQGYNLFDSDDYLDSIYHFITTWSPNRRHKWVCDSPNIYFAILPDGSFAPCCDFRYPKKIYVYDDNFPEIYKSKEFRKWVKDITSKCSWCNYWSYPEMTLTVRSFSTIKERILLQFKAKKHWLKSIDEEKLFSLIDDIKSSHKIYSEDRKFKFRENKIRP